MWFQKVTCGKKVTCDNLYVRSLTQPLTPSQRDWLAESRDAAAWILVRDRFGHEHGLSDYIGPCIPEGPIRHKHAVGVSALQQASMPRERLRSIQGVQRGDATIVRFVIGISDARDVDWCGVDRRILCGDQASARIDTEIQVDTGLEAIGRDADPAGYRIEVEPIA